MFDVITIGGATRDVFFVTSKGKTIIKKDPRLTKYIAFESGSKNIPEEAEFTYGGGGANTAISFAKQGLKIATVLRIGAEGTGSLIVKDLESVGVDCEFIVRDKENHTALSVIVAVPGQDHTMFLYRGANDYLEVKDWRRLKTKWFYLSSLTGESTDIIPELFSYSRAHNIKVAWNPGSEQLAGGYQDLSSFLELTDVLILNKEEATKLVLSRNSKTNVTDEKELLKSLYQMTNGLVVVTDGPNGSYVTDGEIDYFEPVAECEVVETTGAGDGFGSTFVASVISGNSIKEAMKLASLNAASVVSFVGAQKGLMTAAELRSKIDIGGKDEIKS